MATVPVLGSLFVEERRPDHRRQAQRLGQIDAEALEIERLVEERGCVLLWSWLFQERIAFVKDKSFAVLAPRDAVAYTEDELRQMFTGAPLDDDALRLVHHAKKLGNGHVVGA